MPEQNSDEIFKRRIEGAVRTLHEEVLSALKAGLVIGIYVHGQDPGAGGAMTVTVHRPIK